MKGLCILGSTGSIGQNTLRVAAGLSDRFRVVSLAAGRNLQVLADQVIAFKPLVVSVARPESKPALRSLLDSKGYNEPVRIYCGGEGNLECATHTEVGFVVSAAHGITGLPATFEALRAGKCVGLANKETLVAAGELVMEQARHSGAQLLPIDSEHCAVHQCLRSGQPREVRRLVLTASGGPFLSTPAEELLRVTPEQALKHPIWRMGGRITIDSATLMNKGLEIIEAHWLFGLAPDRIDVVVHPESVIHSMVEFIDGSFMAQLSVADMRLPIQYALTYPERVALDGDSLMLDVMASRRLNLLPPDTGRFPCLRLARQAADAGGALPCALNADDEVAVAMFLSRSLRFADIPSVIESVLASTPSARFASLDDVLACDRDARQRAAEAARDISSRGV